MYVQCYYLWLIGSCICAFDWHQDQWPRMTLNSISLNFQRISWDFADFADFGRNNSVSSIHARRTLRSAAREDLVIPRTATKFGARSFENVIVTNMLDQPVENDTCKYFAWYGKHGGRCACRDQRTCNQIIQRVVSGCSPWSFLANKAMDPSGTDQWPTLARKKIGQYCQRQRCKHVELEQCWHAFASCGFVSDSWAFLYFILEAA